MNNKQIKGRSKNLRAILADYTSGAIPFRVLQYWFAGTTWHLDRWATQDREFVLEAKLYIAEYTSNHRTEDDLKEKLADVVRRWEGNNG